MSVGCTAAKIWRHEHLLNLTMENMREFFRSVDVGLQALDDSNMFSSVL